MQILSGSWLSSRFELARGGAEDNLRAMEGLRGLAVFMVFVVHYCTLAAPWLDTPGLLTALADGAHAIGNAGVDLFFVLSGYLIYGTLITKPSPFPRYFGRRVQRIYPAFLAVFIVYVLLSLAMPSGSKIPAGTLDAVLYLAANLLFLPGLAPIDPLVSVAWSLSFEFFYYLLVPLLIGLLGLRQWSSIGRIALFVGLALGLGIYCSFDNHGNLARLMLFVAGIVLHEVMRHRHFAASGSSVAAFALLAGLGALLLPGGSPTIYVLKLGGLCVCFFLVCHVCFTRREAWLTRLFCWTPLRWLGNMSYSYYLLHGLCLKIGLLAAGKLLPPASAGAVGFVGLFLPMFVLTLLGSAVLFLLVERPYSLARAPKPQVALTAA